MGLGGNIIFIINYIEDKKEKVQPVTQKDKKKMLYINALYVHICGLDKMHLKNLNLKEQKANELMKTIQ